MNKDIINKIIKGSDEFRGIPFWSWNNTLEIDELESQIVDMKNAGLGGFIMHARIGLTDEYLGEKWFSCVKSCLDKAKELNMKAWIYDENGWPSGFVGGKLLENESFRARFLEYKVGEFDSNAYVSYVKNEDEYIISNKRSCAKEYHNIYIRVSPANTDILNPLVVDSFIKETHERYYERFSDMFGKEIAGFFTDEPQFYRWATPYTDEVRKYIDENYLKENLIYLFIQDEKGYVFREKYYGILNHLYVNVFYKRLYDWCESHNCMLTGHSIEESALYAQMWGGGAVMPTYEFEHIPAIDCLGRCAMPELGPKQVASVASQLGKKKILTETFACSGYDATPKELKSIADAQLFHGVNMICHHLYPFSIAGQGKIDHPTVFGKHSGWLEGFKSFNDYLARLGYIVANTKENTNIAILHPIREIWNEYTRSGEFESVKEFESKFFDLLLTLRKKGITYHFIDETILEKYGKVDNDKITVGNEEYDTLLVAYQSTITSNTYSILKEYKGKICILGNLKYIDGKKEYIDLKSNTSLIDILNMSSFDYICKDKNSFMTSRKSELGEFIFIKNLSINDSSIVEFKDIAEKYKALDLLTFEETEISNTIELNKSESIILIKEESAREAKFKAKKVDITSSFKTTSISSNYLVIDYVRISKDGINYSDNMSIPLAFEKLLREDYKGTLYVKQTFVLNDLMDLKLIMEKTKLLKATINGKDIKFTKNSFDINFLEADISEYLIVGENEFIYSFNFFEHDGVNFALFDPLATESLRNCLYYDTSIENIYIKGNFLVNSDMSLSKRNTLPKVCSSLNKEGYMFFKGYITYEGSINYDGKSNVILELLGRFLVSKVIVNETSLDMILDYKIDITKYLKENNNNIKIIVYSSLRNLFGPHHFKGESEMFVGPFNFNMRGDFKDGVSKLYDEEYKTVPFGIDNIILNIRK